jgi:tRNA-splicing ligase RtcB (3'-phosphate/5'-hydroxy nucleic acid ligase)
MSTTKLTGKNVNVHLWTPIEGGDSAAIDQLKNVAALPWVFHHVAVMPDWHAGKGCTVGSVIAMKDALSPATVGIDIGCGMGAILTSLKAADLPDNLSRLRARIEELIPVGFNSHEREIGGNIVSGQSHVDMRLWNDVKKLFERFDTLDEYVKDNEGKARSQVGTLGGGNHFIELCLDEEQRVWMVLHSGSRNIGKTLAEKHIWVAQQLTHNQKLPDRDLAAFLAGTPEMEAYRNDLTWAQEYAFINRRMMFQLYKKALIEFFPTVQFLGNPFDPLSDKGDAIFCHHNYVSEETHFGENVFVTRKGAIRADMGDFGVIPGSMGTATYIVEGLGNDESFCSASHGAGRRLSRGAAKRAFTVQDLAEQTKGIECRKDEGVLDEIPGAYKDIDQVMEYQKDLVKVRAKLHQVLCVKG